MEHFLYEQCNYIIIIMLNNFSPTRSVIFSYITRNQFFPYQECNILHYIMWDNFFPARSVIFFQCTRTAARTVQCRTQ